MDPQGPGVKVTILNRLGLYRIPALRESVRPEPKGLSDSLGVARQHLLMLVEKGTVIVASQLESIDQPPPPIRDRGVFAVQDQYRPPRPGNPPPGQARVAVDQ